MIKDVLLNSESSADEYSNDDDDSSGAEQSEQDDNTSGDKAVSFIDGAPPKLTKKDSEHKSVTLKVINY